MINNSLVPTSKVMTKFIAGIINGRYQTLSGHHKRIKRNAILFAQKIGLSKEDIKLLTTGVDIHDIGNLSISDYILNKPAQLTHSEREQVKQHTGFGKALIAPLNLDPRINEIVLYHHENYDGSGYPEGLQGNAIPVLARMTRILDSYDALTMNRPYHFGVQRDEALKLLQQNSYCYDPYLLKFFCKMDLL